MRAEDFELRDLRLGLKHPPRERPERTVVVDDQDGREHVPIR